jgi:CheY-like chemotaxis protein
MSSQLAFPSVGVVDDDKADRELVKYQIEDSGAQPVVFGSGFHDLDDLLTQVRKSGVRGVICDHRLRVRHYAPFSGAEAVERLVLSKIPAVLVSSYGKIDVDTDIRPYRRMIPVLLPKEELDSASLMQALGTCLSEMLGKIPASRRPHRALVRIDSVRDNLVDAFIPAWNPAEAIRFPISLIPVDLRSSVRPNQRFFAQVNTSAEAGDDLFLQEFEPAPEVGPKDDIF